MKDLKHSIENLFITFSQYTTSGIHYCDCGCVDEEDVKKLHSKPLRQLETEDIAVFHGKALYTWGEIEHYKHFLPRVLELYSTKRKLAIIDLYDIGNKLEFAKWTEWPLNEVQAVKDFIIADWIDFVNDSIVELRDTDLENYSQFLNVAELLKFWNIKQSEKALKNFVLFFYYFGNQILDRGSKISEKQYGKELRELIYTNKLIDRLQDEFFNFELREQEYAEKVSIVLQMVEQQLNVEQINSR